jgi:RNA polymerase sigma-54 factor
MALNQRLDLRQTQGLVITPQLQQAIKLLQLSNLELESVIEAELERNPLLEREEPDNQIESIELSPSSEHEGINSDIVSELSLDERDAVKANSDLDNGYDDRYEDGEPPKTETLGSDHESHSMDWSKSGEARSSFDGDEDGFGRTLTKERTLHDHLIEQVQMAHFTPAERALAQILIDSVDEGGYLRASTYEIADRMGCALSKVESVLSTCQGFDPTGVFARSVPECLKLQLIERNRFDPAMAVLLDNLELLARRDLGALRKLCGVDHEDLQDMISDLKALNPRPGASFVRETTHSVIPDVFVKADPAGGWKVELNVDTLPKVLINQRYHSQVSQNVRNSTEKDYLNECLNQANWLIRSLDQRARTILKVSSEIVRQQDAFFVYGIEYLRPLNLKTVAEAVSMHESTISRVTTNKFMITPRGTFELKFFFTSGLASSDGEADVSAESVRHRIKSLIDQEKNSGEILSDDKIVEILKEAGVDIARRTVAKYREALRIPSSLERKRMTR